MGRSRITKERVRNRRREGYIGVWEYRRIGKDRVGGKEDRKHKEQRSRFLYR